MISNLDSDQSIMKSTQQEPVKGGGIAMVLSKEHSGLRDDLRYEIPKVERLKVQHIETWCNFVRQQHERKTSQTSEEAARRRTKEALASREASDTPLFGDTEEAAAGSGQEPQEAVQEARGGVHQPTDNGSVEALLRGRLGLTTRALAEAEHNVVKFTQEKAAIEAALGVYDGDGKTLSGGVPRSTESEAGDNGTGEQKRPVRKRKPTIKKGSQKCTKE